MEKTRNINRDRRVPLKQGNRVLLYFLKNDDGFETEITQKKEICIEEYYSSGSTCLTYRARMSDVNGGDYQEVIVQEFYPSDNGTGTIHAGQILDDFVVERQKDGTLNFHFLDTDILENKKKQFFQSLRKRKELRNVPGIREFVVSVYGLATNGAKDNYYVVSEIHEGKALNLEPVFKPGAELEQKFHILSGCAEILYVLNEKGYLFTDFKPENLLCVKVNGNYRNNLYLFDTDSIIQKEIFYDDKRLSMDEIFVTKAYLSPQIDKLLERPDSFESNRVCYDESCSFYSLALLAFEMLLGKKPDDKIFYKEDGPFIKKCLKDLYHLDNRESELLKEMLYNLFPSYPFDGDYQRSWNMIRSVEQELHFQPQQSAANASRTDYLFGCYDMLDRYPVYEFCKQEEENGFDLKVAIIAGEEGLSELAEHMIRTLLPGLQMLNSTLTISIYSENVLQFWDRCKSQNPELEQTVAVSLDDTEEREEIDKNITDMPFARIRLMTMKKIRQIATDIMENDIRYLVLLGDHDENYNLLEYISEKEELFFAGTADGLYMSGLPDNIVCHQISVPGIGNCCEQMLLPSRIFKMANVVDHFYSVGLNGTMTKEERRRREIALSQNTYNLESSERCALHTRYALASIGLTDQEDLDFSRQMFFTLNDQKNRDTLAYLEHKSWVAYMVCSGKKLLRMDDYEAVAFKDHNDWCVRTSNRDVLEHPYMVSSTPEIVLTEDDFDGPELSSWDELDRASWNIYNKNISIIISRKAYIEWLVSDASEDLREAGQEKLAQDLEDVFGILSDDVAVCENSIQNERKFAINMIKTFDYKRWENKILPAMNRCPECSSYTSELASYVKLLRYTDKKDIKRQDYDIIDAFYDIFRVSDN